MPTVTKPHGDFTNNVDVANANFVNDQMNTIYNAVNGGLDYANVPTLGNMASLNTSAKSSAVAAINEVKATADAALPKAGGTMTGDLEFNKAAVNIKGLLDYLAVSGKSVGFLASNAYFDGTNWNRYDTTKGAAIIYPTSSGFTYSTAPAGANPIAFTDYSVITSAGGTITGDTITQSADAARYLFNRPSGGTNPYLGHTYRDNNVLKASFLFDVTNLKHSFLNSSGTVIATIDAATGEIKINGNATLIKAGSGSPEGVVTANVGSIYLRTDGAAGTTLYKKTSGTGNTGWTAS